MAEINDTGTGETRSVDTVLYVEEPPVGGTGSTGFQLVPAEELAEIWGYYRHYRAQGKSIRESCALTGAKLGRTVDSVYWHTKKLRNTTALATDILKAGAAGLAQRIIEKANVDQAIEVLTRSNIGVLAPKSAGEGGGGGGIFINVQAENLGAVKVGVLQGAPAPTAPLEMAEGDLETGEEASSVSTYTPESTPTPELPALPQSLTSIDAGVKELTRTETERNFFNRPPSPDQQNTIAAHRARLAKARSAQGRHARSKHKSVVKEE